MYQLHLKRPALQALAAALSGGPQRSITHIGLSDLAIDAAANPDLTQLPQERDRQPIQDEQRSGSTQIFARVFDGPAEYAIRTVGAYLDNGLLLGVFSVGNPDKLISYKPANGSYEQQIALDLLQLPGQTAHVELLVNRQSLIHHAELVALSLASLNHSLGQLRQHQQLEALASDQQDAAAERSQFADEQQRQATELTRHTLQLDTLASDQQAATAERGQFADEQQRQATELTQHGQALTTLTQQQQTLEHAHSQLETAHQARLDGLDQGASTQHQVNDDNQLFIQSSANSHLSLQLALLQQQLTNQQFSEQIAALQNGLMLVSPDYSPIKE